MDSNEKPVFTEGEVARRLGVDRLEVYLLAASENVGQFDNSTHLLMFTPSELQRLAARVGREQRRQQIAAPDGEKPSSARNPRLREED